MMRREVGCGVPQPGCAKLSDKHVRATIALSGPLAGTVSVLLPEAAGVEVIAAFAGRTLAFGSAEFRDAAGEMANIVAGAAITHIGVRNVKLGCPKTAFITSPDAGASQAQTPNNECFVLSCVTQGGTLLVEVSLVGAKASAKAA
ncbi:MAG: chemotaxis protein CheX [Phycisphaerae bacterium]|nr:chemotaxis protein CheX [Phycisphaerae bacterium]